MRPKTVERVGGFLPQMLALKTARSSDTEIHQDVSKSLRKYGRRTVPATVPPPGTASHPPTQRPYQHKQAVDCTNHHPKNTTDHPSLLDTNTQNSSLLRGGSVRGCLCRSGSGHIGSLVGADVWGRSRLDSCRCSECFVVSVLPVVRAPQLWGPMCPAWRVGDVPAQQSPRSSEPVRAGVPKYPPAARGVGGWLWWSGGVFYEVFFRGFPRLFPRFCSSQIHPPVSVPAGRVVGVGANPLHSPPPG